MEQQTPPTRENGITDGVDIVGYLVNDEGNYELISGPGWQPVNIVNRQAWQEIEKQIEVSKDHVDSGRVSCLHYYMTINQMNIGLLAGYTNQSRLRVRLHLIPFFFKRLGPNTLKKYGDLFQVSTDDLKNGRIKAPIYDAGQQAGQRRD
ncbi:MAG: hypothetical protein L3J49_12535 [Desulfobulbaceae bacterium]|nr:hypothetical protein [Desulfobulbaceae bacterium]